MGSPTAKMIDYATSLLSELGYDPDEYDFDNMTFEQVRDLIDELKDERGYQLTSPNQTKTNKGSEKYRVC